MVFYFSGTGNSKYVAQKIADNLDDKLVSISDSLRKQELQFTVNDNERIGFIFPTYFWGTPTIVQEFVEKLKLVNYKNQYVYCVVTCGDNCGDLFSQFGKSLSTKGIKLNGASEIILPDNYILLFNLLPKEEKRQKLFAEADENITALLTEIQNNKLPLVKSNIGKYIKTQLMYAIYTYGRKTKHFYVTDTCISCNLCEKVCPIDIIAMKDGKPTWEEDRCVQCLACLHRCPQSSIQHKKRTENRGRYVNPNGRR